MSDNPPVCQPRSAMPGSFCNRPVAKWGDRCEEHREVPESTPPPASPIGSRAEAMDGLMQLLDASCLRKDFGTVEAVLAGFADPAHEVDLALRMGALLITRPWRKQLTMYALLYLTTCEHANKKEPQDMTWLAP